MAVDEGAAGNLSFRRRENLGKAMGFRRFHVRAPSYRVTLADVSDGVPGDGEDRHTRNRFGSPRLSYPVGTKQKLARLRNWDET